YVFFKVITDLDPSFGRINIFLESIPEIWVKNIIIMLIKNENKHLPIINDVDICILGGSCTGVFAAVRAARLGAKVAIIEKQGAFGGVATVAKVNTWHSLRNTDFSRQII